MALRRTVERAASISGIGLHTGCRTTVTCHPAEAGHGIVFRRTDLPDAHPITARLSEVSVTERRTGLGTGAATIHTVEHLLAAIGAFCLDDLLIEIDGPEPPIVDGSFQPYMALLAEAGPVDHGGDAVVYRITEPFEVTDGDATYVVAPASGLRLTTTIEWDHPLIGRQVGTYDITEGAFATEIAPARTFGFASEVDTLRAKGLIKGASTDNAVVLTEDGVEGTVLRWPDEFLRHKTGDIVGDLTLLGARLEAHVVATRPNHHGNIALAQAITRRAHHNGFRTVIPFSWSIASSRWRGPSGPLESRTSRLTSRSSRGTFPGTRSCPGSSLSRRWRRWAECSCLAPSKTARRRWCTSCPVVPGDQLRCELELVQFRGKTCRMRGVAYVDGDVVAEADMMARVMDR